MVNSSLQLIDAENIRNKIYVIRGLQVMLDFDLAKLYDVPTSRVNEQVRRNKQRFPNYYCFKLTLDEFDNLISQFATSSLHGGRRKHPYAFTEQGVAMLSSVLRSDVAVYMSIKIINAFVSMRRMVAENAQLFARVDHIEQKQVENKLDTDKKFDQVFKALTPHDAIPQQKIFFNNQVFDAHKFVFKIIRSANTKIVLIDNFIDENVLDLFTRRKTGVELIIYTKNITKLTTLDAHKFNQQYGSIQLKEFNQSHDRFLIIDNKGVYHFGASIKDLGKKWFAYSKFDKQAFSLLGKLD